MPVTYPCTLDLLVARRRLHANLNWLLPMIETADLEALIDKNVADLARHLAEPLPADEEALFQIEDGALDRAGRG